MRERRQFRDVTGRTWLLGRALGFGGFARVYESAGDSDAVIKVFKTRSSYVNELFAYQSLLSGTRVDAFRERRGLGHLGIPEMVAHGPQFMVVRKLFPIKQFINEAYRDNHLVMIVSQLLDVLEFLHGLGWTHNDIKYDNVMMDRHRNIFLIDYGLVTTFVDAAERPSDGPAVGTRSTMSLDTHRGFINPPRGDLLSVVFMLKLLMSAPWDVDRHAFFSRHTATLIEKEAFAADPRCGAFTEFARAVLRLEYSDAPDYRRLKTLLPTQPTITVLYPIHQRASGRRMPPWMFAVVFQAHILPHFVRVASRLSALQELVDRRISAHDLVHFIDAPPTGDASELRESGLVLLGQDPAAFTSDAAEYVALCLAGWIAHVGARLRARLETSGGTTVHRAIHQMTDMLNHARPWDDEMR